MGPGHGHPGHGIVPPLQIRIQYHCIQIYIYPFKTLILCTQKKDKMQKILRCKNLKLDPYLLYSNLAFQKIIFFLLSKKYKCNIIKAKFACYRFDENIYQLYVLEFVSHIMCVQLTKK